jgi:hypothetical protein
MKKNTEFSVLPTIAKYRKLEKHKREEIQNVLLLRTNMETKDNGTMNF